MMEQEVVRPGGLLQQAAEPEVSALRAAIPDAVALARLLYDYSNVPAARFHERYPEFVAHRASLRARHKLAPTEAMLDALIDAAEGIAARSDETQSDSAEGKSPVAESDAP